MPEKTIVGVWDWVGNIKAIIGEDGTARGSTGVQGKWECVDTRARKYQILWTSGIIDNFILSADGNEMNGSNNRGQAVSVRRLE